jgi:Tol biopolymer transport system component
MKITQSCRRGAFLLAVIVNVSFSLLAAPLQPVSVSDPSVRPPAAGGGDSYNQIISPDGRYLLFASTANNLALNSNNAACQAHFPSKMNVFLRDRTNAVTTLVSINLAGTGGGNGDSIPDELSTNGAYALFESSASDLVPGDTNNVSDLFVRDLVHGTTLLVSTSTNGGSANGPSGAAVMTPDGRFVAFSSAASNLVPRDTNGIPDIFVRDLRLGSTTIASPGAIKATGVGYAWQAGSDSPEITPDGRYVAFLSAATNLVPGVRTLGEIYVRDLVAGATFVVSTNARSVVSSPVSYGQVISDDGQFVAFESTSSTSPGLGFAALGFIFRYNLQTGTTERVYSNAIPASIGYRYFHSLDMTPDGRFIAFVGRPGTAVQSTNAWVYLWDGQTALTTLVSADTNGAPPTNSVCDWPTFDASGRFVAFLSTANNLTTNAVSSGFHLYVRDLQQSATTLIDAGTSGASPTKDFMNAPRLSSDGRFVAFDCTDADLVPNDSNNAYDVFVHDLVSGANDLISARLQALPSATPTGTSSGPVVSVNADGRYIAFASNAGNLVAGYSNIYRGVFVRDLLSGTNLLISVDTNGVAGADGMSAEPAISANGRYIVFTSSADNLVTGDINNAKDVFIRDLQTGATSLISVSTNTNGSGNGASYSPAISADGRYALFHSRASNLAAGSSSASENLLWRDLQAGTTYTVASAGISCAAMTSDGHFVAFGGPAANMYLWDSRSAGNIYSNNTPPISSVAISPDGNRIAGLAGSQLYVGDRSAQTNWLIAPSGPPALISHGGLQFSGDGRLLVYTSQAAQVPGDTNLATDIYLYDFQTGSNFLVTQSFQWPGAPNGPSDSPAMSADGRYVAYRSFATDLILNDTNGQADIFLYDRQAATTTLLSASPLGEFAGNGRSSSPLFSADGQTLVFQSWASDLLAQDFNQSGDLLAVKFYSSNSAPVFKCEIIFAPASGHPPTLSWAASFGTAYQVQFKDNLSDPVWQVLNGNVTVIGDRGYAIDFNPSPGYRFYRVMAF